MRGGTVRVQWLVILKVPRLPCRDVVEYWLGLDGLQGDWRRAAGGGRLTWS